MSKDKKFSLAEVMGTAAAGHGDGLKLSHLPEILGDAMPELPRNPLGRHRLIRSLQQRFGKNFRSLPGIKNLIKEFDDDVQFELRLAKVRNIKAGK